MIAGLVTVTLIVLSIGIAVTVVLLKKEKEPLPILESHNERLISTAVNSSVDKCNDFYGSVCGLFESNNTLPKLAQKYGLDEIVVNEINGKLREILNDTVNKSNLFQYVGKFYKDCTSTKWDVEQLKQFISKMSEPFEITTMIAKALTFGSAIVDFKIKPNPFKNGSHAIWISKPKFNILPQQLIDETSNNENDVILNYKSKITMQSNNVLSDEQQQLIIEAIKLESDLAKIIDDDITNLQNVTLETLVKSSSRINWFQVLQKLPQLQNNTELKLDTYSFITNGYFKSLDSILSKYPDDVINVYILLRFINDYGFVMAGNELSDFQYMKKSNLQITFYNQSHRCMDLLIDIVPDLMGRLLFNVTKNEPTKGIEKVFKIAENIKNVFKDEIKNNRWIGEETKQKLISKIDYVLVKVAYPDIIEDEKLILSQFKLLEQFNESMEISDLLFSLKKESFRNNLERITQPVNRSHWTISPASSKVNYDPVTNSLTIPAGALNPLFFHPEQPNYINYAGIGVSIAHQLMQGFILDGLYFDQDGQVNGGKWLPSTFWDDFEDKSRCLVNTVRQINNKFSGKVNGKRTLSQNLADVEALKLAFKSFTEFTSDHSNEVPCMLNEGTMSSTQLFLIFYQSNFCQIESKEWITLQEKYSFYAPNKFRTILSLMNLKNFTQQFNCSSDSLYFMDENCVIW